METNPGSTPARYKLQVRKCRMCDCDMIIGYHNRSKQYCTECSFRRRQQLSTRRRKPARHPHGGGYRAMILGYLQSDDHPSCLLSEEFTPVDPKKRRDID